MDTANDPFLKIMEGRVPKPTVVGAAPTVVGEGQPLRPDRSYGTLKWLSTLGGMFGLDHFYLRNPYSGLLKAVTLGGFLIWWLWDAFQLWTEKDRVLLYGMSAPFDLKMGFGQGTIAEGKTSYEQRSDSALWMLAALFSFAGADSMLLGNWGQMLRKLTELAVLAMFVLPLLFTWNDAGIEGLLTLGNIFRALCAALIGFIVLTDWANVMFPTFGDPAGLFKNGIRVSAKQDEVLNFPRAWVENIWMFGPDIQKQIMKDIGYTGISGAEMRKDFEVRYVAPGDKEAEAAAEDAEAAAKAAAKASNPIRWHWVLSYLVYLFGPLIILAQLVWTAISTAFYAAFPAAGLVSKAKENAMKTVDAALEGKNPLGELAKGIPGLSTVSEGIDKVTGAASGLSIPSTPPALSNFVKSLPLPSANSDPTHAGNSNIDDENPIPMRGGAREAPTGQGMILGASVFALAGGAAIKLAVDYLLPSQ